jgi:hypothetical protein
LPVVPIGAHAYAAAPLAVNVAVWPTQIAAGLATADTVGVGNTCTVLVADAVQLPSVATTVYTVVDVGLTVAGLLVRFPGFHVKLVPVVSSDNDELWPLQITAGNAAAAIDGTGFTVMLIVVNVLHPSEFVPVTVYVVETVGQTTTCEAIRFPGFHV